MGRSGVPSPSFGFCCCCCCQCSICSSEYTLATATATTVSCCCRQLLLPLLLLLCRTVHTTPCISLMHLAVLTSLGARPCFCTPVHSLSLPKDALQYTYTGHTKHTDTGMFSKHLATIVTEPCKCSSMIAPCGAVNRRLTTVMLLQLYGILWQLLMLLSLPSKGCPYER
jgi:hypothetical protein